MTSNKFRQWPAALALLATLLFFGSYLYFTEHLVREVRREARIQSQILGLVQRGLISQDPNADVQSLFDIQGKITTELRYPIVVADPSGTPIDWSNLPFAAADTVPEDVARVREYTERLAAANPPVIEPGIFTIYYGSPPILNWLRWVPWLQMSGGIALVLIGFVMIRSNLRAERERTWASMARELAHQMGTPLSSLTGWVELLQLPPEERVGMPGPDQVADQLAADVERLEGVSRRFELIGKPPILDPVPVGEVLSDMERYIRPRLPRLGAGIELRVRHDSGAPRLLANRVLLSWALENLVKNAIDALAGRGGRIFVAASAMDGGGVRINVVDNGPGIAATVRKRLFEPGVSTKSSGWGVGLSLTRRIVEDYHRGTIAVRPRRSGGTVFEIRLPSEVENG